MYLRATNPALIPQTQPYNERQVRNNAGGFSYEIDKWDALDRFLIIGTQGGTYYVGQDKLTQECTDLVNALLAEDPLRVINRVVEVSQAGRAVKQDYGIYVLALAIAAKVPDAYRAIPQVCRTASTLFQLVSYLKHRKGWSRGLRNAIARWYNEKPVDKLAYQMVKYQNRNGYTHKDLLRLAHVEPFGLLRDKVGIGTDEYRNNLYRWAVGKPIEGNVPTIVHNFELAKNPESNHVAAAATLPREALPTEWLNEPEVWRALLMGEDGKGMPLTAMIRNLGNLSKCGLLENDADAIRYVAGELTNDTRLEQARIHPISVLLASKTYASGHGFRGKGTWAPSGTVLNALNEAFIRSFRFIPKSNKSVLVAIDVSGSMSSAQVNETNMYAFEVAGAMSLAHRQQFNASYAIFDTGWQQFGVAFDDTMERLVQRLAQYRGGGTDLGQAIIAAQAHVAPFDAIVVYTDSETWAGRSHLDHYLQEYRKTRNPNVKLVIAATTATRIAGDIQDPNILQVVGFDASTPQVIGGFIGE